MNKKILVPISILGIICFFLLYNYFGTYEMEFQVIASGEWGSKCKTVEGREITIEQEVPRKTWVTVKMYDNDTYDVDDDYVIDVQW